MNADTLGRLVALTELSGVGDKRALELYTHFDSLEQVYTADSDAFSEFHYIDEGNLAQLETLDSTSDRYEELFRRCERDGIDVIGIDDSRYPTALRDYHAPLVIYAVGETSLLHQPSVSFAGSRETDSAGRQWASDVAEGLASEYVIVSGGALGADAAAHEGALRAGGKTLVVLGTGVENMYPNENRELFDRILDEGGLVISHRPPDAGPSRHGFLHRNKTTSGLSDGVVIVATDGTGGTMSQYSDAVSQGKHVFVPPLEEELTPTEGVREILEDGEATPITSAKDVVATLDGQSGEQSSLTEWR